ncbi:MAG: RodZ domain-containing protein [Vicinamibacterales bacterium]
MTDVGDRLRRAREQAGLDIQDISATTKIKPGFLLAIERGTFEQLPGRFFVRNFLRTYAREVGLSPDEVVAEFDEAYRPVEVAPGPPLPKGPVRSVAMRFPPATERSPARGFWPAVALGVLLLVIGSLMNRGTDANTGGEPGAVGTAGVAAAGVVAAPAPAAQPEPVPDRLTLEITPTEQIWVAATADGERAVYRMLEAGERVRIEARREMSFRIGNAAAFQYAINGTPGKPLGGPGEVREFQITGENYRSYRR